MVLFVIDLKGRRVHVAGITINPNESFVAQVARNLADPVDGFLRSHRFLPCDSDTRCSARFRRTL